MIAASAKRAKLGLAAALVLLVAALGIAAVAVKAKLEAQNQTQTAKLARLAGTRTANDLISDVAKKNKRDAAAAGCAAAATVGTDHAIAGVGGGRASSVGTACGQALALAPVVVGRGGGSLPSAGAVPACRSPERSGSDPVAVRGNGA